MTTLVISVLTILAAVPAVGFLALYSRMPWWRSQVGRGVMIQSIALAELIGMGVLRVFFGTHYAWREFLILAVYMQLVIGLWFMFIALLVVRRKDRNL